jgi:hypothetical protein
LTAPTALAFLGAAVCGEASACCIAQLWAINALLSAKRTTLMAIALRDGRLVRISNQLLRNHIATPVFVKKT